MEKILIVILVQALLWDKKTRFKNRVKALLSKVLFSIFHIILTNLTYRIWIQKDSTVQKENKYYFLKIFKKSAG